MLGNIGLFSYGVAALAYTLLSLVVLANWRERSLGWPLLVASIATALWAMDYVQASPELRAKE